jgi:uracil-DNA glycosylase
MDIKIESSWKKALDEEFSKPYFSYLLQFIKQEKQLGKVLYPPGSQIFNAFDFTPLHQVKVVILGQDPYHGPGQANGLCFSVNKGIAIPPSLKNIYKELQQDLKVKKLPLHGDLSNWAKQGVFLLNATLTVEAHRAGSHQKKGWELFTDAVIQKISSEQAHCVFILWGNYAKSKLVLIDSKKHLVLTAVHPSPLSAYQGFFGTKPFSKANDWLALQGVLPINWQLDE